MTPPPPPPELMDELVGEILLRVPPDDPAFLLRTSLVCKAWRRLLTSAAFLRRYRAFPRKPPVLGFLRNKGATARFVPTASLPPLDTKRRKCRVLDCRHGRALLYVYGRGFLVWDPITGEDRHVPHADIPQSYFNAAVMCAAGADCCHQDCHGGPFLIVLVGTDDVTYACAYSSESGQWSAPTTLQFNYYVEMLPPALAGGAMHFICQHGLAILRYDLHGGERALSGFDRPERRAPHDFDGTALIPAGDSGLIYAGLTTYSLHLWSLNKMGDDGVASWTPLTVIKLNTLLPAVDRRSCTCLVGTAPGTDESAIIFVSTDVGIFAVGLKSHWIRKVCEGPCHDYAIFPYSSVFAPDHVFGGLSAATSTQ